MQISIRNSSQQITEFIYTNPIEWVVRAAKVKSKEQREL